MTRMIVAAVAAVTVVWGGLACAGSDATDSAKGKADWTTVIDTAGDTIVIRTTGGSESAANHTLLAETTIGELDAKDEYSFGGINELEVSEDGRIYVYDRQVPALREYDAAGTYVRTLGRKGKGPGEYEQANGLAIHRDGRVVLWDAGTAHINVYRPDGTFLAAWPLPGGAGFYTSGALFVDTAGNTYARTRIGDPPKDNAAASGRMFGLTGLVAWDRDGKIVDSLAPPEPTIQPWSIVATQKGSTSQSFVPFSPRHTWAWSPLGYFVSARTDQYAIILQPPGARVRRIERDTKPVAVTSEERADYEERSTWNMRQTDPTWRWSGPGVPGTKPAIASLTVADDGRIWVSVSRPGERLPLDEAPAGPTVRAGGGDFPKPPPQKWRDPTVYDVFDPTGQYLGRVAAPAKTSFRTMRGDYVWAVRRDSLDVEQVVRFKVVPGFSVKPLDVTAAPPLDRRLMSLGSAPER